MNLYRLKALTGLFLVCDAVNFVPTVALAQEATSSSATSTATSITQTIIDGAVSTWNWGRGTANTLALIGTDKVENLKVPVLGVQVSDLTDTWGDARSSGRTHEGIDIMVPRNTPIISPTKAVVSEIGYGALGGNYVYTINPGGERFYYAHLDHYANGLVKGQVLQPGDVIGYVGNTGNASGGPTHLHFGIYNGGASNPYPRLILNWTGDELTSIKSKLSGAVATVVSAPASTTAFTPSTNSLITNLVRNLTLGSTGEDVRTLQKFLNTHGATVAQSGAGSLGNETTYFGNATKAALALYQRTHAISPALGYLGPITRSAINTQTGSVAVR